MGGRTKPKGIIITEGADATGKTTLQNYFVEHYNAIPMHLTYNKLVANRMFDYQTEEMLKAIEFSRDSLVVVDRHWLSERIYAKVFRGGSPWPLMGRMMDRVWRKHAAVYVLCMPADTDVAVKRHHDNIDPAHPYPEDKYRLLLKEYQNFYNDNFRRHDVIPYYIESDGANLERYCDRVVTRLMYNRQLQYTSALDPDEHNILGHLASAKYVFIGDKVNTKNVFAWPFYEYQRHSLFFAQCLEDLNIDDREFMFTNVLKENGKVSWHFSNLVKDKGLWPIALGQKALTACVRDKINHPFFLRHPQYAKRFGLAEEFKEKLTDIMRTQESWK
jgi:hypothetical protein